MTYVYVILPLKLSWRPVYKAPDDIAVGERVRVIFAGKERTGVVSDVGVTPDVDDGRILEILGVESGLMPFSEREIRFWEFLSEYYMCSVGEVFKAACPVQKIRSEQTAARVADRAAQARLRTLKAAVDTAGRRAERLAARIAAKEASVAGRKPGTKARASLESDIARLTSELEILKTELTQRQQELETFSTSTSSDGPRNVRASGPEPDKPQVLIGSNRQPRYASSADEILTAGGQVLILTPEKAFCAALEASLGIPATVFTSDLSAPSRRKISDYVRSGSPAVILGTRSALWLPWNGLRLVIVDEEQDTFHKQTEPAPRLHARDAAVALAGIHGAQVLLGTACPSLETRLNILSGKYTEADVQPPTGQSDDVEIIDIPAERRKNGMLGPLSRKLVRSIAGCRGPVVLLRGWEKPDELAGQIAALFPDRPADSPISVMTLTEMKREGCGGAQILAVLQADALVSRDDFRADERALQLIAQFRSMCPHVTVQTAVPDRFAGSRSGSDLLRERKVFGYPPYRRMIDIIVSDRDGMRLSDMSDALFRSVEAVLSKDDSAMKSILQDGSVQIRILLHRDPSSSARKAAIRSAIDSFERERRYPGHIIADVDPQ